MLALFCSAVDSLSSSSHLPLPSLVAPPPTPPPQPAEEDREGDVEGERDLSDRHGHAPDGAAAGLQGLHEAGGGGREEDWLHRQPAGEFIRLFYLI